MKLDNVKKIFSINLGNYGSTGNIVYGIGHIAVQHGFEYSIAYPQKEENQNRRKNDYVICSDLMRRVNHRLVYYSGFTGCFAVFSTVRLLHKITEFDPDIIHLHNIHGDFINIPLLFHYIKKHDICVVWTLHDCWAVTGRCPYFSMIGCEKWKTGCGNCEFPQKDYPESMIDWSEQIWNLKRKCFTGVKKMILVTPSHWLANIVKDSFLKEYPVKVINNGIDLSVFTPVSSDFREKYGLERRYIVLGVSFGWSIRKGIDVFIKLAGMLGEEYQIVLVGTDENLDKYLPDQIISIHKTKDQNELASIYSAADVFLNPTREEVLGMTNIEALACGTPVITFRTGGSPECIDNTCGMVIERDDIDKVKYAVTYICENRIFPEIQCLSRARKFNYKNSYIDYIKLYKRIINC